MYHCGNVQSVDDATANIINAADLGSNSVRFAGPVRDLSIGVITPTTNAQGNSRWGEDSTAGLAGVVTVAKANARCLTNSGPHSCDYTYGSTAVINRITLNKRDAQGRGLWVTYFTNGGDRHPCRVLNNA